MLLADLLKPLLLFLVQQGRDLGIDFVAYLLQLLQFSTSKKFTSMLTGRKAVRVVAVIPPRYWPAIARSTMVR